MEELQQALNSSSAATESLSSAFDEHAADSKKRVAQVEQDKAAELKKLKRDLERNHQSELTGAVKAAKDELKEEHASDKAPEMALKNRLLFHLAHKMDDQEKLMMRHQELTDTQGEHSVACNF